MHPKWVIRTTSRDAFCQTHFCWTERVRQNVPYRCLLLLPNDLRECDWSLILIINVFFLLLDCAGCRTWRFHGCRLWLRYLSGPSWWLTLVRIGDSTFCWPIYQLIWNQCCTTTWNRLVTDPFLLCFVFEIEFQWNVSEIQFVQFVCNGCWIWQLLDL